LDYRDSALDGKLHNDDGLGTEFGQLNQSDMVIHAQSKNPPHYDYA